MTALVADTTDNIELPRVPISQIHDHPANPRRDAVAGDDMVESIRQQGILDPLMVAPRPDGGWVLIDGHRRKNGAIRAGLEEVPVNPRYDLVTDSQQIEVMAITGLQKELLSPVEEAAAYEQLALLGMDDNAIAAATGFTKARIQSRKNLGRLTEQARDHLHDGQLTLGDAEAMLEFADDQAATAKLDDAIGTGNFRQQVHLMRQQRTRSVERDAIAAGFREAGAVQVQTVPGDPGAYVLDGEERRGISGMHMFPEDLRTPTAHDGCLAYTVPESIWSDPRLVCIDPARHPSSVTAAPAAAAPGPSEWEKQQAERHARAAKARAASAARMDWLRDHFAGMFPTKSHKPLAAAAKAFLPALVVDTREAVQPQTLAAAFSLPDTATYAESTRALAASFHTANPTRVLESFGLYIAALVGEQLDTDPTWLDTADDVQDQLLLWDWLKSAGYQPSDFDLEIRTRLESKLLELTDDEAGND